VGAAEAPAARLYGGSYKHTTDAHTAEATAARLYGGGY